MIAPSAQGDHDPDRLSTLVSESNYEQAYQLAEANRGQHAGVPRFDFHYGVAAVETGHLSRGIFALERVLIAQPGADRARLELARAYFLRGDDRRARREFRAVQAHDPPANVQARVDRYLLAIQRRADRYETSVSGHLAAGIGHDSNVNAATASDSVDTVVGRVDLPASARERADSFGRVEGRAQVSHPVAPGVNLLAEAGARGRFYGDEDAFNRARVDGGVGGLLRRSDWQLRAMLTAGRFYLDSEVYRDQAGVNSRYQVSLSERTSVSASLDVVDLEYETNQSLDATLGLLGTGMTHRFAAGGRPTVSINAYLGSEDADNDSVRAQANAERDLFGVRTGVRLGLDAAWMLRGSLEARASEYEQAGLLFSEAREEQYYRALLALDWRPRANWRIGPRLQYTRNQSNIDLYEYERTEIQLRARYDFY
jgi:hypothetical protein